MAFLIGRNKLNNSATYILNTNEIAAGSNKIFLDLWNSAGSESKLLIKSIQVLTKTDVAATGVVSVRHNVFRTTSQSTGGTSVPYNSVNPATATIVQWDTRIGALPAGVIAKTSAVSAGNIGQFITHEYSFSEETNAASYFEHNILPHPIIINQEEGLMIQQGSVASVNSYSIVVVFTVLGDC